MENQEFLDILKNNKTIKSFIDLLPRKGDERFITLKLRDDRLVFTSPSGKSLIEYKDSEIEKITALYKWKNFDSNSDYYITINKDFEISEIYLNVRIIIKKFIDTKDEYKKENIYEILGKYTINLKPLFKKLLKILKNKNSEIIDTRITDYADFFTIVSKNDKFKIIIMTNDL